MACSTARACLRKLSPSVHSHNRFQASSRVGISFGLLGKTSTKSHKETRKKKEKRKKKIFALLRAASWMFFYIDSFGVARRGKRMNGRRFVLYSAPACPRLIYVSEE